MKGLQRLSLFSAMAMTVLLSGCSGEPSESDVRAAIERNPMMIMGLSALFFDPRKRSADTGAAAQKFLREAVVQIDGCAAARNAPGYVCDFRIGPTSAKMTPPMKGRFFKASDGWQFEQMR